MFRIGYKMFYRDQDTGRINRIVLRVTNDALAKEKAKSLAMEMGIQSFGVDKIIEENLLLVHEESNQQ